MFARTVLSIFLVLTVSAEFGHGRFHLGKRPHHQHQPRDEITDLITATTECVRENLNAGLPDFGLPSFNPLIIEDETIDLNLLNSSLISGEINVNNAVISGTTTWQLSNIQAELDGTTYTESFAVAFDDIEIATSYRINVAISGVDAIWGEGKIYAFFQGLNGSIYLQSIVDGDQIELLEFAAPIELSALNFNITGLYDELDIDGELAEELAGLIVNAINDNPELFIDVVGPVLVLIFNALVNDDIGLGIVKYLVQECVIDIINPPAALFLQNLMAQLL